MSSTEPHSGQGGARALVRDKKRTRRAVLEAAERVVARQGSNASLAEVAAEAGVTKGGLMHHFRSRDELEAGLVGHVLERLWEEVMAHVDITENRPGKFTRGYVRAVTGDSAYLVEIGSATGLLAQLGMDAGVEHVLALHPDDPERWNRAFAADGLPAGRVWAIRYAAEGLAVALGTPYVTDEQLRLARTELLALSEVD